LAGVTFLDCAGVRALAMAASFAPSGYPVIIRSLSPTARRILELLGLDIESIRQARPAPRTARGTWTRQPVSRHLALPELGEFGY
ncbi:MAG TPA: STAS domain-containing protein, partial [Trebonia sp.]|nr:STAS domain-containing protein [Trebonia sp.]